MGMERAPTGDQHRQHTPCVDPLHQAMASMRGYAAFASLGCIYAAARSQFGFDGSLEDAFQLLEASPEAEVESAARLEDSKVTSTLWHPHRQPRDWREP